MDADEELIANIFGGIEAYFRIFLITWIFVVAVGNIEFVFIHAHFLFLALEQENKTDEWVDELDDGSILNGLAGMFDNGNSDPVLMPASSFYGKKKSNADTRRPKKKKKKKKKPGQNPAPKRPAISQVRQSNNGGGMDRLIKMSQKYDDEYAQMLSEEELQMLEIPEMLPNGKINSGDSQETDAAANTETGVTAIHPDSSGGPVLVAKVGFVVAACKGLYPFAYRIRWINRATEY